MSGYQNQGYNGGYNKNNYQNKGGYNKGNYQNKGNGGNRNFGSLYRKNVTNTKLFDLVANNPEGSRATFKMYVSGNAIRIRIYTGMTDDENKQNKAISFDFAENKAIDLMSILLTLRDFSKVPFVQGEQLIQAFSISGYVSQNQRGEIGKIIIGRDGNGVYYISGIKNGYGKVRFDFNLSPDTVAYDVNSRDNTPAPVNYVSERVMMTYIENAMVVVGSTLVQEYADKDEKKQGGNNNYSKGNYQKGNYNNGGNNYQQNQGGYQNQNQGNQGNQGNYQQPDVQQGNPDSQVDDLDSFLV